MSKVKVIIKRNAVYEKGMYGLSIHDQPGGAASVEPLDTEAELRERLLGFGLTVDYTKDVIDRLQKKHDFEGISVDHK
jgi:hypothetical protein